MKKAKRFVTEFWAEKVHERNLESLASNSLRDGKMVRLFKDYFGFPRVELVTIEPMTESELNAILMVYNAKVSGEPNRKVKV